jgi:ribosomal protein S18 acetylase RimI-like enzyme
MNQQKKMIEGYFISVLKNLFIQQEHRKNMWNWRRTFDIGEIEEILSLVEPNKTERNAIIQCIQHTDVYRMYVAERVQLLRIEKKLVDGIAIATWLPQTETLHVEDFAIHPRIRGQKHAAQLWQSWWRMIVDQEKWVKENVTMTIEVYLHNVEAWRKIMQVNELFPEEKTQDLPVSGESIVWMGARLKDNVSAKAIQAEWMEIQMLEIRRRLFASLKQNIRSKL